MKQFYNCLYPADTLGTGWWRVTMPASTLEPFMPNVNISINRKYVLEDKYNTGMNMVMFQRPSSTRQREIVENYYIPLSKIKGFWTIYNIDDCLHKEDFPDYNPAKPLYTTDEIAANVKCLLNGVDFVLVTTEVLKKNYNERFGVPLENIIVIPNYLPSWWIGNKFNSDYKTQQFIQNKKRPRIGIISSPSHFNTSGNPDVKDDLDIIIDAIEKSVDTYQWVFFSTTKLPRLQKYFDSGRIIYENGVDIFNYPNRLDALKLQAVVVPLLDNQFNRCKSNIKLLEAAALGIPAFLQNIPTYSDYAPVKSLLFNDSADLLAKMKTLLTGSTSVYRYTIINQYNFLNAPHKEAPNGWWLERNYDSWMKLFKLRSKPIEIQLKSYLVYQKSVKEKDTPKND